MGYGIAAEFIAEEVGAEVAAGSVAETLGAGVAYEGTAATVYESAAASGTTWGAVGGMVARLGVSCVLGFRIG